MLHAPTLLPRSLGPRPSAVGQTVPTLNRVHLYKTRQEPNPYAAQHLPLTHERHRSNRTRAGATPEPSSPQGSSPLILDSAASSRLWYPVQEPFTWQGSEEDAVQELIPTKLTPPWKMMLLSDGSVTRHLQLLTRAPVTVECLAMDNIGSSVEGLPKGAELVAGPRVQRQVLLWSKAVPDAPLVYATSWWAADEVDKYLADKSKPIWVSLSLGHIELYREIHCLWEGSNAAAEAFFKCKGPFWARQYFFWHDGRPLTLIYEVFSNRLQDYLGPTHVDDEQQYS